MFFFIQFTYLDTLVYTPGYPGRPQPTPHETIPESNNNGHPHESFLVTVFVPTISYLSPELINSGPPLSPWQES